MGGWHKDRSRETEKNNGLGKFSKLEGGQKVMAKTLWLKFEEDILDKHKRFFSFDSQRSFHLNGSLIYIFICLHMELKNTFTEYIFFSTIDGENRYNMTFSSPYTRLTFEQVTAKLGQNSHLPLNPFPKNSYPHTITTVHYIHIHTRAYGIRDRPPAAASVLLLPLRRAVQ